MSDIKNKFALTFSTLEDVRPSLSLGDQNKLDSIVNDLKEMSDRYIAASSQNSWWGMDKSLFLHGNGDAELLWSYLQEVTLSLDYTQFESFINANIDQEKDLMWNVEKIRGMGSELLSTFSVTEKAVLIFPEYVQECWGMYVESKGADYFRHKEIITHYQQNTITLGTLMEYTSVVIYTHLAYGFIKKALQA